MLIIIEQREKMKYKVLSDKIIIEDSTDFDIMHILECGQVFTYTKNGEYDYDVYSLDNFANVKLIDGKYIITTQNPKYFVNYFDLDTDYNAIKKDISKNEYIKKAVEFGHGIRILHQSLLEVIIGFIISANNNILRITKTMQKIREFGENKGSYYAFPTLERLHDISVQDFINMGAGYRAQYLFKVIRQLDNVDLNETLSWDTKTLKSWLLSLMGVGPKVADCILLFGYGRCDCFPVDTWIEKVYIDIFETKQSRAKMSIDLVNYFGKNAGYAQQYLFFYRRSFVK